MSSFVHTPYDYVPTDDETDNVDDEEYDRINKEMYDDVNVELKDTEPADEGKGDEEMTDTEKLNAEYEEVNQEDASAQVQDEAQAITTAAPAQKEVKILRNVEHNLAIHATIKSEVPIVVRECLGTNPEDSLHKVIQKQTADFVREHIVPAACVIEELKQ
ncbi:hypothetical protein Tco_0661387 [Tanacetum coccineum]